MAPDPSDFLAVDAELSAEERDIRDAVRDYGRAELAPRIAEWYESNTLPREIAKGLGALGLLGMHLEGYGCAGTNATSYGLACRELEAIDSGLRSFVSVQGSLAMFAIHRWGSEEHKREWLPRMASGDALGCFGLTEPDAGSSGIRGFVVPTDTPGFAAHEVKHKLSLRASLTAELVLEGVRVPADAVFPDVTGLKGPLSCLNEARYGILWGAVGAARSCFEAALDYAKDREQFGQPIAGFQLTQRKLADMVVAVNQAGLTAARIGRLKDAHELHPSQVSFGKMANVRAALDVARTARTVLGGNGITLEYPVFRHMTNLETVLTYEGTEEIHALAIGQALTGISAYR